MPQIKNDKGEPIDTVCINKCGSLKELDEKVAVVVVGAKDPQRVTVLICSECQYMELYYGA